MPDPDEAVPMSGDELRPQHPQLRWAVSFLKQAGIPFWLDSGTLLGVVREGDVIPGDSDIDIGLWAEEESTLLERLARRPEIRKRVQVLRYGGQAYSVYVKPEGAEDLTVSFCMYSREGPYAYRPAIHYAEWMQQGHEAWRLPAVVAVPANSFMWRLLRGRMDDRVLTQYWPFCRFFDVKTWKIPARHFDQVSKIGPLAIPIPASPARYLQLRYGPWEQPDPSWDWFQQDGALIDGRPEEVMP